MLFIKKVNNWRGKKTELSFLSLRPRIRSKLRTRNTRREFLIPHLPYYFNSKDSPWKKKLELKLAHHFVQTSATFLYSKYLSIECSDKDQGIIGRGWKWFGLETFSCKIKISNPLRFFFLRDAEIEGLPTLERNPCTQ